MRVRPSHPPSAPRGKNKNKAKPLTEIPTHMSLRVDNTCPLAEWVDGFFFGTSTRDGQCDANPCTVTELRERLRISLTLRAAHTHALPPPIARSSSPREQARRKR